VFCDAKYAPKLFSVRAYDAPPYTPVGWGGRRALPIPSPLDTFGLSIWAPLALCFLPPSHPKQIPVSVTAMHPLSKNYGYASLTYCQSASARTGLAVLLLIQNKYKHTNVLWMQ